MTLFAGICSLQGREVHQESVATIRQSLSRGGAPEHEFLDPYFYVAKVDVGALGVPAFVHDDVVAAVTGEPLLAATADEIPNRARDLEKLIEITAMGADELRRCRGTFSFFRYDPRSRELLLATDLLGARAVYFHAGPEFLYFSSNLRVLESLGDIPKRVDSRAIVELASFGSALADRTPYAGIYNLRGAEYVSVRGAKITRGRYFRWSDVPATTLNRQEFAHEAYRVFLDAVACRAARHETAVSFLTGGLDSRVVVAALSILKKTIFTINFKYTGLMDGGIAAKVAAALGTRHLEWPVSHKSRVTEVTCTVPARIDYGSLGAPKFPRAVFSGDGGSVGLGFVYMDERIVSLIRAGKMDELAGYYLRKKHLTRRVFRPEVYRRLSSVPLEGLENELESARGREPAKSFHLFLMNNDQRRHIHRMYEDLDLNRVEYLLPLYDARWLELIASAPVDWFLLHRFYYEWLELFPEPINGIPWQAYPGHLPCPQTTNTTSRPQWNLTHKERYQASQNMYHASFKAILNRAYPRELFNHLMLLSAAVLHGCRLRNYDYVWSTFDLFRRYGQATNRQIAWPSTDPSTD